MADISQIKTPDGTIYNLKDTVARNGSFVAKSGDTMTGALSMAGRDILLKTSGSSSNDSGDIVWYYGNGQEKARLWTNDAYTAESGLNFRMYKEDGTSLFSGTIPLRDTNTTYSAGAGISLSGATFSNSGVRSISTGSENGTISVNTNGTAANVSVKGLGSAAYLTASTSATANTVAQRQGNGYLYAVYYNTSCGAENPGSYTSYAAFIDSNGWLRKSSRLNFAKYLTNENVTSPALFVTLTSSWGTFGWSTPGQARTGLGLGSMATENTGSWQRVLSTTTTTPAGASLAKYGNVVWLPIWGVAGNNIGTIPAAYRPKVPCRNLVYCIVGGATYVGVAEVNTSGVFNCWYYKTYGSGSSTAGNNASTLIYGGMTWITA